jgi:hypothetical protein
MAGEMSSSGRSDSGDSEDSLADTLGTPTGYHELEEENDGDAERLKFLASLTSSFGALEDVFTALLIAYRKEYGRLPTLDELGPLTDYALVLFLGMRTGLPREGTLGLFYLKSKYVDVKYTTMQDRGLYVVTTPGSRSSVSLSDSAAVHAACVPVRPWV